jgi:formate/nitrite transporter FocA (FNT family)
MSFFSPAELVQKASDTALHKNRNSLRTTLILAFLAGAYIALGGLLALVVGRQ